jgi:hypothetical protein
MTATHIKVSAAHRAFATELSRLERFDTENQRAFSGGTAPQLSEQRLYVLTEAVFSSAFRAYEAYVRDVFLLYARGRSTKGGKAVKSFLDPVSALHAEQLMKQSKPFLDWSSPDAVIQRADLFLRSGAPVKNVLSSNSASLKAIKVVRNHIAHNSDESMSAYKKVVLAYFGTLPIQVPAPGAFLLLPSQFVPGAYLLKQYFRTMSEVATGLAA